MDLISLAKSRYGPSLAMALCRTLPRRQAYWLADRLAGVVARQNDLPFVTALRANMAVVRGLPEGHPAVERAVGRLMRNALRSHVDLFRGLTAEEGLGVHAAVEFDPTAQRSLEACRASGKGLVLVGVHTCSFDILLLSMQAHFPSVQILTNAHPVGSSQVMNALRIRCGVEVTPISVTALRSSVERLRGGGVIALAADLPVEGGEALTFFGRSSRLPVGHARLALGAGAQMVVGASYRLSDGVYRAVAAPVPAPTSTGDRQRDVLRWAQRSFAAMEKLIRARPEEWLMPLPLWPQEAPAGGGTR